MTPEPLPDQGEPDLMAALEESLRDRWICSCGRRFVSRHAAAAHPPLPSARRVGWDGVHFCDGEIRPLASDEQGEGADV